MELNLNDIAQIVAETGSTKNRVIPILQAIQKKYNYLPKAALEHVCSISEITPDQITGVSTFYSQFRHEPAGKHLVKVCVGTACHVKGAMQVYDALKRHFKMNESADTDAAGNYTLEKVSCLGCCTLAPVVQIDKVTYGHVTTAQIASIINDFESRKDEVNTPLFRKTDGSTIEGEVRIGLGSCCVASGSDEIQRAAETAIAKRHLNVTLKNVGCVGMCHRVPLVEIVPTTGEPTLYTQVKPEDVSKILASHFKSPGLLQRLTSRLSDTLENVRTDTSAIAIERYNPDVREKQVSAFLGHQIPIATEHRGHMSPLDIDEYIANGGFEALKKVLDDGSTQSTIETISRSGLRGRGGAGFPTGTKWQMVAESTGPIKYLICNGDEGDPGAFMDRMLLESYPFRVVEGLLIAAYAVGATEAIFYIRAEYPLAVERIGKALEICRERHLVGSNIMNTPFSLSVSIYQGAGAFVCGEETALMASIMGERGFPNIRPPYPAKEGLFGFPTLINNTETFAQVPYIIRNGYEKFASIGIDRSKGTKVFALAGKVARGGLIEVPMGITINEVVNEIGGGVANGRTLKAVQIGGPSGGCVPHWLADTQIDYESLGAVGAMMGSGGLVVLDDTDCMVDIARYFLSFTQNESCGKCTFCRVGTKRMLEILERITEGKGKTEDLAKLEELAIWTKKGSLCGLGKSAPNPVLSTLKHFRNEYEAHINGICPTGKCKALIKYTINSDCFGCTKCAQVCPVDAIAFNPHQLHMVDTEKCIKCDACRPACPVDAIKIVP